MPIWSPGVPRSSHRDVILVVGVRPFLRLYVYFEPAAAIPEHIKIVHIDQDPWQIGKNYPVEVGLLGDLKVGLAELDQILHGGMTSAQVEGAERARQRSPRRTAGLARRSSRKPDHGAASDRSPR